MSQLLLSQGCAFGQDDVHSERSVISATEAAVERKRNNALHGQTISLVLGELIEPEEGGGAEIQTTVLADPPALADEWEEVEEALREVLDEIDLEVTAFTFTDRVVILLLTGIWQGCSQAGTGSKESDFLQLTSYEVLIGLQQASGTLDPEFAV